MADLESQAGDGMAMGRGTKRPMGMGMGGGEPMAKRPVFGGGKGGKGASAPVGSDPEKAALVDKIKSLQRTDPDAKAAWWAFCDEQLEGVKDPNRQDADTLRGFLAAYE